MPQFDFTGPDGKTYTVNGPDGSTQEQAFAVLQRQLGSNMPQAQTSGVDQALDVARGAAKGITEDAASGLIGLPGDVASAVGAGAKWAANKIAPDATAAASDWMTNHPNVARLLRAAIPATNLPTSSDVESVIDKTPLAMSSPTTSLGQSAENVASFIPQAAAGPEGLAANVLKRGVLPGVASELAGKATEGTPYETTARVAGSLVAPSGNAAREAAAAANIPTSAALTADGGAGRNAFRAAPFATNSGVMSDWANRTLKDFDQGDRGFEAVNTPQTSSLLRDVSSKSQPFWANDLDSLHYQLGQIADTAPQRDSLAALTAQKSLEDRMTSFTKNQTLLGDPDDLAQTWKEAQGNYAAGMRGKTIDNTLDNALGTAAKNNSGQNIGNDIRNAINPLTKDGNKLALSSGFNQQEINAMRNITRGTMGTNLMRYGSNLLGGGGGIGSLIAGGIAGGLGTSAEGAPGSLAGPAAMLAGIALRRGYNRAQVGKARDLSNMVRSRSPLAAAAPAAPASLSPVAQRLLAINQALSNSR